MIFYDLKTVEQSVGEALRGAQISVALDLVRASVDTVINNPRSVARVLASQDLDNICRQIAGCCRASQQRDEIPSDQNGTVIIATELAKAGGHVELIKDYVRCGEFPQPITLILTDCFNRIDDVLSDEFSQAFDIKVENLTSKDSGQKLFELTKLLRELNPENLLLVTHNQDSVAIVAALSHGAKDTFFIHHGDHHLCLGVTLDEFLHVDVSEYGYCNCRNRLKIRNNFYWPIVLQGEYSARSSIFDLSGGLRTCAVGREEKFQANEYSYDYFEIVPEILSITGGSHVHIGPLDDSKLAMIYAGLSNRGLETSCFIHVPWVSSVAKALIQYSVDMYMVSFPYGGAKSAIEAMASGLPVLVHKNYRSILASSYFVVYDEAFSWGDVGELLSVFKQINPDVLARHSASSRTFYDKNYTPAVLKSAIRKRNGWEEENPEVRTYYTDGLQAFLDEERFLDKRTDSLELKAELNRMYGEYAKIHAEYLRILEGYNKLLA